MSINWNWNEKIGTWEYVENESNNTFNIYECNGLAVWLKEWKNEKDEEVYQLAGFFADKAHAKNCLGLNKGYENIYENETIKLTLFNCKTSQELIQLFSKAKFKNPITIEILPNKPWEE